MSQQESANSGIDRFTIKDRMNNTGGGDNLPERLKKHEQWLVTHDTPEDDENHKSPKYPAKRWNDRNLLSFDEARTRAEQDANTSLAFSFTKDGPFVGFDLDDVKPDDKFTDEALKIVRQLDSYTEVSSSGTGLHVISEGEHEEDRQNRGDLPESGHLEVYDESRYFVLTGDVYDGYSSVESRVTAVQEVQHDYLPPDTPFSVSDQQTAEKGSELDGGRVDATPEQVRRTIEEYIKGGDVDKELLRLWNGSDEGRESTSEADMALVAQLYFWCKGDQQLMDDCFRTSGRMRPKWEDVHSSNGATYGEMTIHKACGSNRETFQGDYVP